MLSKLYVIAPSVCPLSVRLSVIRVDQSKTVEVLSIDNKIDDLGWPWRAI